MEEKASPGQFAQQFSAPVLLIHSANDKIVKPEQSQHMFKMLKQKAKPAQLVMLEGDDHHLREGETRTKAVTELVNFVHQHLQ
jgi:dipeptidyl aminopeptidase/acylaminoacyl peptidase